MRRKVPSLAALRVFVAAAQHQNFRRAAEELSLTESAVSRQVANLERQIGAVLFMRDKRRVRLTQVGLIYAAQVGDALTVLEGHTLDAMAREELGARLELACLPTFAAEWLIPRLPRFTARYPHITLNISTRSEMFDLVGSSFDAVIHCGEPNWPQAQCNYLFSEDSMPVCRPELLQGRAVERIRPADLAQMPLVHLATRRKDWLLWLERAGESTVNAMRGPYFEQHSLLMSAVRAGMGVGLLPRFVAQKYLDERSLVALCLLPVQAARGYYLVLPDTKPLSPPVQAFKSWLLEEARSATSI